MASDEKNIGSRMLYMRVVATDFDRPNRFGTFTYRVGVGDISLRLADFDEPHFVTLLLKGVKSFQARGGEMPAGMLLAGPPGTGKTFLAGCMAAEANLPFIYVDASSLSSMWMGVDALIVISLFRKARGLARKFAAPGQPGCCDSCRMTSLS